MVQAFLMVGGVTTTFGGRLHANFANDINAEGVVVGRDEDERASDPGHAWVRQTDGTVQILPKLQPGFASAQGINRSGAIVGYGKASDGNTKAMLWFHQ